ncbi:MAG: phage head-tail connector protein [Magnetococcales bacterium]|nr:phage head-tail connector protein [Magnetococcales bacterium]
MALTVIIPPASEPVTLAEGKLHLRVDGSTEDALVTMMLVSARERAEMLTGRQLMPATYRLTMDYFPCASDQDGGTGYSLPGSSIMLPVAPVTAINSIKYVDMAGLLQTMAPSTYLYDLISDPVRIHLPFGMTWPITMPQIGAVRVEFVAGYANAAAVPNSIKQWILMTAAGGYTQRENVTGKPIMSTPFLDGLLDAYKVVMF